MNKWNYWFFPILHNTWYTVSIISSHLLYDDGVEGRITLLSPYARRSGNTFNETVLENRQAASSENNGCNKKRSE
jgi:hypothetical protein